MIPMPPFDELWSVVKRIPHGRVSSYGEIGKVLKNPTSGYFVGRWMANCPSDVPWWRVVAKDGRLPISKRSPELGLDQESRLQAEGIKIEGGLVDKSALLFAQDLDELV